MDWKEPFRFAFEFGMWSFGWLLVLFVGTTVLVLAYAIVGSLYKSLFKKKKSEKKSSSEEDLEAWAKSKSLRILKNNKED
jgi:hypothetical protein